MKLHLMSDLHLGHDNDPQGASFLLSLKNEDKADVLILAGDLFTFAPAAPYRKLFGYLSPLYKHILFVPGNHDYWGLKPHEAMGVIDDAAKDFANVRWFHEPGVVEIEGQKFFGGTMWYPRPRGLSATIMFPDFKWIDGPRNWIYNQYAAFVANLNDFKSLEGVVVISHHLPSSLSTPAQFKGDVLDHFFVSDMTKKIVEKKPRLWMHGHTHDPCDYVLGQTRVVCHPRGYPKEYLTRAPYQPLLIEI